MRRSNDAEMPRTVRLFWLAALLVWDDPACFAGYRRRLGISMYAFQRDVRAVRRVMRCLEEHVYIQFAVVAYLWWLRELT